MARKLPEIPKCKLCGGQVLGHGGAICRTCQMKKTQDNYRKVIKAEQDMSGTNSWLQGYSPWKNILLIPCVITLLIFVVLAIYLSIG